MKYLYLIFFVFIVSTATFGQELLIVKKSQLKNPFRKLKYTHIMSYTYSREEDFKSDDITYKMGGPGTILTKDKKLHYTTVLPGSKLSKEDADTLINLLIDTSTYGSVTAACFQPHWAVIFYNNDSIVACIDICLSCNYMHSTIYIPAQIYYNYKFYGTHGAVVPRYGFSKTGRKKLLALCKKFNMPYCEGEGESTFDE